MNSPSVTVAVLTFNGEQYIDALISAVEAQRYDGAVEILIIDSGSTDATLPIVAAHSSVRLHEIPNAEFGHGRTRDLAARLATGDIVAYLTQDAVPRNDRWLHELVLPMADDPRIAAVVGRQIARPSAPPVIKYDIRRTFDALGPRAGITVVWDTGRSMSRVERDAAAFYSDANSAARREILTGPVPYADVDYAEDQVLGRALFDGGYRRAYAPAATVEHSNDTTLLTFGARIDADLSGLRRIGTPFPPVSLTTALKQWLKWTTVDSAEILIDPDYSLAQRLMLLASNPWYHAVKWGAYRRAANRPLD